MGRVRSSWVSPKATAFSWPTRKSGKDAAPKEDVMAQELAGMKRRMVWSFAFLIPLFYISMGHMMGAPLPAFLVGHENAVAFGLTQLLLTLPIMYLNDKYYKIGRASCRERVYHDV